MASFSCSCSCSLCLGSSSSFSSELAPKFMQMSNKPVNSLQQFPSLSDAPARPHLTYEVLNIVPQNAATYRLNPIWAPESPCGLRIQLLHVRKTFSTICEFNLLFVWCFFLFCLLLLFFSVCTLFWLTFWLSAAFLLTGVNIALGLEMLGAQARLAQTQTSLIAQFCWTS